MHKLIYRLLFLLIPITTVLTTVVPIDSTDQQSIYDINAFAKSWITNLKNSVKMKKDTLDIRFRNIKSSFENRSLLNILDNSTKCVRDLAYTAANIKSSWALKMLDSFGKPESGILVGNLKWLGEYKQCMQVYAPPSHANTTEDVVTGDFRGQYCSLTIPTMMAQFGICIPDSCTSEVQNLVPLFNPIDHSSLPPNFSIQIITDCKPREKSPNVAAVAVIALLILFSTLVVISSSITAVKYFLTVTTTAPSLVINITNNGLGGDSKKNIIDNRDEEILLPYSPTPTLFQRMEPFFKCFCIFKNGAKLLNTDTSEGELLCIHGIRFLSMSWVILGHTYMFPVAQMRNLYEVFDLIRGFAFQIMLQAFYSVDSFFVLSGFLLTYLCMQQFSKSKGSINWPYFYIHRYLRLTPVYMIVLGFYTTVYLYLGSGPFWPSNDLDVNCHKSWWWNLLYINNFTSSVEQCMNWSWYLANDMQFFVISPIILAALWRWPKIGYAILGLLLASSWIANFYLTYHFDLMTGFAGILNEGVTDIAKETERFATYFEKIYSKPYTRISPYLIGMLLGYILHIRKQNNSPKHSWGFLSVGWIVATTITLATVYGLYHQHPSLTAISIYNALSRTVWGLGLCWVIYVCLVEQGGFINSLLSYKFFIPLSRLTYVAYLIHPMIIGGYYGNLKSSFEFSHPTVVLVFLGVMVVTYALALPVALVLESPIIMLEKLIRKKFSKKEL